MSDEEDFEEQLQQEHIAKVEAENKECAQRGLTYTDTDGSVMEWDPARKAYFPKIDSDFIARYQMNYGTNTAALPVGETVPSAGTYDSSVPPSGAWQDYYSYYNEHGRCQSDTAASAVRTEGGHDQEEGKQNYTTQDYYNYYAYYYGEDYATKWMNTVQEQQEEEEDQRRKEQHELEGDDGGDEDDKDDKDNKDDKGKKGKKRKGTDKEAAKIKPPEEPPAWFEMNEDKSTHVYVSGLPADFTDADFKELMAKCGLIMFDPLNLKPKLKLYRKSDGSLKGDGLCCYIKQESVDLALKILDGSNVNGSIITVERAKFQLKGEFDPAKKKKKLSNKAKKKMKEKQAKLFDWRPDMAPGTRLRFERIVILKNMFDPTEFETEPTLINELREDVRTECMKFGEVRKVQVYDHHPEGVVSVILGTPEEGDACVAALKGRWFAKRQIHAETYDGKTKYEIKETDAEREERLKGWEKFLQTDAEGRKQNKPPLAVRAEELSRGEAGVSRSANVESSSCSGAAAAAAGVSLSQPLPDPGNTDHPQSPGTQSEGEGAAD